MSICHKGHLFVIPEDDSDRQIANGFRQFDQIKQNRISVLPIANGWPHVPKRISDSLPQMSRWQNLHILAIVDFDEQGKVRYDQILKEIPEEYKNRVFVIGARKDPETLHKSLCLSYEEIGLKLADECFTGNPEVWICNDLEHNELERERLSSVRQFLFFD